MGGCIAQQFAVLFPERTQSVTIICSWANVDPWLFELWQEWEGLFLDHGPVAWARATWLWVFTYRAYRNPDFLGRLLRAADAEPNPQSFEMYIRQSYAASTHNLVGLLPSITAPAHVICGEEDIFTPPRYSIEIAHAIPGARLTEMPDVGHGMFWEATDAFNGLVRDFIDDHPINR
jgi:pimeloyl-ACP methyl ester carboxylesterase